AALLRPLRQPGQPARGVAGERDLGQPPLAGRDLLDEADRRTAGDLADAAADVARHRLGPAAAALDHAPPPRPTVSPRPLRRSTTRSVDGSPSTNSTSVSASNQAW